MAEGEETAEKLKRERAGTYRTVDGRFTVEQTSSGWLLMDAEQADELGLPLARGPFPTLDDARGAIASARSGPVPQRVMPSRRPTPTKVTATAPLARHRNDPEPPSEADAAPAPRSGERRAVRKAPPPRPLRPPVVIREIRTVDGDALRAMWREAGFGDLGDDDKGLARLARRNPGLVLVAAEGSHVVGSALGAWDGRRGWIYHVAVLPSHRRRGIATRLVDQIETGLANLGCPKANVMVRPASDGGAAFWEARGYGRSESRQYGKVIGGT